MKPTIILPPFPDERWRIADQLGIDTAVVRFWDVEEPWWDEDTLRATCDRFAERDFSVNVIEDRPPMDRTVLGRDGRDEEISAVKELLWNMGTVGIDTYCWVWTQQPLGVLRTSEVEDRGGSIQTGYDHAWAQRRDDHPAAGITEDDLWSNLEYFLDKVVPVAEEAGVNLALHPDDPPISPIQGVPRLVTSVKNYERILDLHDSPRHGVTFCQGNFSAMDTDVHRAIQQLGDQIHFVHFRDVAGTAESFVETWHEDGPTDMRAAIDAYREVGFEGPIRPDHVPRLVDEDDREEAMAGYTNLGRLFAIGYMRGLLEQSVS